MITRQRSLDLLKEGLGKSADCIKTAQAVRSCANQIAMNISAVLEQGVMNEDDVKVFISATNEVSRKVGQTFEALMVSLDVLFDVVANSEGVAPRRAIQEVLAAIVAESAGDNVNVSVSKRDIDGSTKQLQISVETIPADPSTTVVSAPDGDPIPRQRRPRRARTAPAAKLAKARS
ncbi:hypothetical protein COU74_02820 [Candidatus Peregrinibacteria bacterium CG10_big_fil_rev_8_21_14_0_10_36_19]|nr:MAG: hypothetical protein COU74_02820 [Candidatus Peregrinibacteria bacterium CG10_big_fil_rev_8_21_14_0_10_36_19]